jgi:hypothetical protein
LASVFLSAAVTCFAALFLGQAALRLAGARKWSWLAPAVGLSVAMLLAAPTVHVPGRATTMTVLLALLAIAAAVWCLRSAPHRPPLLDLLAAAPLVFLTMVPFLAVEHGGILGVTVNNDMTVHLAFTEGILHASVAEAFPLPTDYPLGPHNAAALLSRGLGIEPDLAFSGWTMAIPVIGAWTVLAAARNAAWYGKAIAATVAGMPYLVAAYYAQGSFKEVAQAVLVLAIVLYLSGCGPRLRRGHWAPFALLVGGVVSAYSPAGLTWVIAIFGLWLAGLLAIAVWRRRLRETLRIGRRELLALGVGAAVLVVFLLPQAHRMYTFVASREGTGISTSDVGNLVSRLPGWEALGVWGTADYRFLASNAYIGGIWGWFVIALILFGTYWAVRRGRWLLPLAALAAMLIWKYSDNTQSIYVAGKALVIASPLLLLVAVLPLLDREEEHWPRRPRWVWLLVPLLGITLFLRVGASDLRALAFSPVGPTDHARQLMSFRPYIAGKEVLFFDEDEFEMWELAGSHPVAAAFASTPQVSFRPRKEWEPGHAMDLDSVPASTLNDYEWLITSRDPVASEPPPHLRLVRATEAFELWKRTGRIPERSILGEGEWPGAIFRCDSKQGQAIVARGGVAAIRRPPLVAPVDPAGPGETVSAELDLPAGTWELGSPYISHLPVEVTAPGLNTTLPANLERMSPRWPIGRIALDRRQRVTVSFHVADPLLAPSSDNATFAYVVATPAGARDRIVPIARACGKYVDWFRSGP